MIFFFFFLFFLFFFFPFKGGFFFLSASAKPGKISPPNTSFFFFSFPALAPSTSFYVVKQIFPKDFFYFYKTMLLSTDDHLFR